MHTAIKGWVAGNVSVALTLFLQTIPSTALTIYHTQWLDKLVKSAKSL